MFGFGIGKALKRLADSAGLENYSYSGRGMFGRSCFAISVSHADDIYCAIGNLIAAASNDNDDLADLAEALQNAKHDSLGLGAVFYFPRVEFPKEEEEEEEN